LGSASTQRVSSEDQEGRQQEKTAYQAHQPNAQRSPHIGVATAQKHEQRQESHRRTVDRLIEQSPGSAVDHLAPLADDARA
jgi:hypothetical protein